jgi:hypothetical protein
VFYGVTSHSVRRICAHMREVDMPTDECPSSPDICMKCKRQLEEHSGLFNWTGHGGQMCVGPEIMNWR